ncbi:acyl-CoA carboxylase epsilon subunit [Streptomyces sp. NPDC058755]|uniref:acyl-CoA carboxylase epsilon subunit n=1 Tax=Streptomyces sp. NPDC058755 TaxID=3346624 RepID=UPI0036C0041F
MLRGSPSTEDLAVLAVVLRAVTGRLAAAPDHPGAPRAGWDDTRQGRCRSAGSWRAASQGWGRGNRHA